MQLTIVKSSRLNTFVLPEKVSGNFWITDFENGRKINLLNIEEENGEWKLISNNDAYLVDAHDVMIPFVILQRNAFYLIKNNYKNEKYYLYVSDVVEETYKEFGLEEGKSVIVGSGNCDISYKLKGVNAKAYSLTKEGSHYYINIEDQSAAVYLNEERILNKKRIEYGDIIFTFGLKVILLRKNSKDYLLVNNPGNLVDFNASFVNVMPIKSSFVEDNMELSDDSYYQDNNYFYRTPYFYTSYKDYEVKVDSPPTKKEEEEKSALLTVGPMLTMSMTSVVSLMTTISGVTSGEKTLKDSLPSVIICCTMLASCILWPLVTRFVKKIDDTKKEKTRQRAYKKYINSIEENIEKEREKQTSSLRDNNVSITDIQNIIKNHDTKLWQRRITDEDFLTIPVGNGNSPMKIKINYPEKHFTLEEDNLLDIAYSLGEKKRILENVPISYDFYNNIITGIVGSKFVTKDFIDRVILQMVANYSYDELKIVTFTSVENESSYDYVKILPYSWTNDKSLRFFGSNSEDYREVIYYLESVYNVRKNAKDNDKNNNNPHYVIITDAIKSIDNYDFIKKIMSDGKQHGFSIIILVDKLTALPNECKNFINVAYEDCSIFESSLNTQDQTFKIDFSSVEDIYDCAKELANIPLDIKTESESKLPSVYEFLEMYQVGKVEQLNVLERWKKSNPILSLQAPIGIGKSGELIMLDLHEKYHGPHGLIAGTTGSGKSEFIIDYILSLAVNYSPEDVQIILIDYKGGSLAGAFVGGEYHLPHVTGTITNLDGNELNRSLASIESEVKRRQSEFNDAKVITGESTIDIYKYQKLYKEGKLADKKQISHLFIISDEFAELKEQQPEFMDKLISVARVGRSLGIHLILATQKPGGVVDAQIWSNTRFRVCLKVQDAADSNEVLKKPDAAYLKKTGRFYLQVGYDEVYTLGQAAWAGGQYYPSNTFKKDIDTSVNSISNVGLVLTAKENKIVNKTMSMGEELPNIVKYLANSAKEANIKVDKLWLDKISEKIYIGDLKQKYNFNRIPYNINPIIGEYDDPSSQRQYVLTMPLSDEGNAIIYGMAGSGKEMLLQSFIYSTMTSYAPEEVNFYIIDFGAETLRIFKDSPYVGDVVFSYEEEKLLNLFKLLNEEISKRKNMFSEFGGTYNSYIKNSQEKLPNIIVIINGYASFNENYEQFTDELASITREAYKYGIFFIIATSSENDLRIKLRQNFSNIYALNQNSEQDYPSVFGNVKGLMPAKFKGRGLINKGKIFEFQTGTISINDSTKTIKDLINKQKELITTHAKKIPILPDVVDYEFIKDSLNDPMNLTVGVNKKNLAIQKYNIKKNTSHIISSYELENAYSFAIALAKEIIHYNKQELLFINTSEIEINDKALKGRVLTKDFDAFFEKIYNYVNDVYKLYEENKYNEEVVEKQRKYAIFIFGVSDAINKLSKENKNKLLGLMNKNASINVLNIFFIDNPDIIKTYQYEEWFRVSSDATKGIWIGSGITDQTLIKLSSFDRDDRKEIDNNYGYVVNNGKLSLVKLLQNFEK